MKSQSPSPRASRICAALVMLASLLVSTTSWSAEVPTRKESKLIKITARVEAIDQKTREVTLKGPKGDTVTFVAGPEVHRLDDVKVGDLVKAKYHVGMVAELREPTEAEKANPLAVEETEGRATTGDPTAFGKRRIKAVTTIEAIDRDMETVTVKGPRGRYVTARVKDLSVLDKMKVGKTIMITFTEAVAVHVEKADAAAKD